MPDYASIRPGEELNWTALEAYLREHLPEVAGEFSVAQFHGGHANLTYLIRFGDQELVLRRPPFGKIAPGAHDMRREHKILAALNPYFAPAPRAHLLCTDDTVIGSDFVVMERRSGVVIRTQLLDCFADVPDARNRLTNALMKVCADLHLVDVDAAGLSDLGKPDGFAARQLRGWEKRWHLSKLEDDPNMDYLFTTLGADIPAPQRVSIVHGDLKFDNCQFQPDDPDQVSSVFDWDMATLGDPLIDLGGLLSFWPDPRLGKMPKGFLQGDWPTKAYLKEKYAEYSGLDLSQMPWYEALACAKTAVIAQQLYARYVAGSTKDARMEKFGAAAKGFALLGRAILG